MTPRTCPRRKFARQMGGCCGCSIGQRARGCSVPRGTHRHAFFVYMVAYRQITGFCFIGLRVTSQKGAIAAWRPESGHFTDIGNRVGMDGTRARKTSHRRPGESLAKPRLASTERTRTWATGRSTPTCSWRRAPSGEREVVQPMLRVKFTVICVCTRTAAPFNVNGR